VADPEKVLELVRKASRLLTRKEGEEEPSHSRRQSRSYFSDKPYWRSSLDVGGWTSPKLYEEAEKGTVRLGFQGCYACPINCGFAVKFHDGTIPAGGAVRCVDIGVSIGWEEKYYRKDHGYRPFGRVAYEYIKLCDLLGIDDWTTTTRNWFGECIDEGLLTEKNTGLHLTEAGSRDFNRELLLKIAYREGIGDLIAEDASRFLYYLADKFQKEGDEEKAKKALEIYEKYSLLSGRFGGPNVGLYNIKNAFGMIICAVETSKQPRNENLDLPHYHGFEKYVPHESVKKTAYKLYGSEKALDPYIWDYKVNKAITYERHRIMQDSLLFCEFAMPIVFSRYTSDNMGDVTLGAEFYSAITGLDTTYDELYGPIADRIRTLERSIQVREGRRREDDWYFDCVFEMNKKWTTKEDFRKAMDEYYEMRGWDVETGIPKKETLEDLGLEGLQILP
jgi:aldehyde:ferredoxin oxidoreductase